MKPITQQAHDLVAAQERSSLAIDATAGNGHDTEFLARWVGSTGTVWAFDVQSQALLRTAARLEERGITVELRLRSAKPTDQKHHPGNVIGIETDHAQMADHLSQEFQGRVGAVMFNLGYLPGADKSCVTLARSTLAALDAAMVFLARGDSDRCGLSRSSRRARRSRSGSRVVRPAGDRLFGDSVDGERCALGLWATAAGVKADLKPLNFVLEMASEIDRRIEVQVRIQFAPSVGAGGSLVGRGGS